VELPREFGIDGLRQPLGSFRRIFGVIADALQVRRHARGSENGAQVVGHGLLPRQGAGRVGVDLVLQGVGLMVAFDDRLCRRMIARHQRAQRTLQLVCHLV
jgi:hypothetical protein